MNCQTGDIAIVIKSKAGNHGKAVVCLQYMEDKIVYTTDGKIMSGSGYWRVNRELPTNSGSKGTVCYVKDECLMRISGGTEE